MRTKILSLVLSICLLLLPMQASAREAIVVMDPRTSTEVTSLAFDEKYNDGVSQTYYVSLGSRPSQNTTVTVKTVPSNSFIKASATLVFTPDNYTVGQEISISFTKPSGSSSAQIVFESAAGNTAITASYTAPTTGGSQNNQSGQSGNTSPRQPVRTEIVDSDFIDDKGEPVQGIILPPCLRTADAAQNADFSCVQQAIAYYTRILTLAIGIAAFLYLLYGAFQYVSAFGDESKATSAKKTIQYALIGILIASFAFIAVELIKDALGVT